MFNQIRALSAERSLVATLERIEAPLGALRETAATVNTIIKYQGLAISNESDLWERKTVTQGPMAELALQAIDTEPRNKEYPTPHVLIPFGDYRGGKGFLSVISSETYPIPALCSLERVSIILSDCLIRLENTARLNAVNKDQELIIRELRHRNKNSLQLMLNLLPLILPDTPDLAPYIRNILEQRIGALLTLYSLFEWTDHKGRVTILSYFTHLVDILRSLAALDFGSLKAEYTLDRTAELSMERATTIGLIVHELVINSIKHLKGTQLKMLLQLTVERNDLKLSYRDGEETEAAAERKSPYENSRGLGMEIIDGLLKRARGSRLDDKTSPHIFTALFPL